MAVTVKSGQLGLATPFGELLGASTAEMNAELDDYVAMGVDWLRIDIHWDLVQPTANGGYNWSLVDKVFHAAADRGIEIIAVPNNFPNWVDGTFSTTSSQTAYANFAKAAAQHFGDLVDYWEIYNEPNMHGINPANYTKMLRGAYTAIKSVDSGDVVITGGTAAVPSNTGSLYGAVGYLEQIYANGGKGYFDAVGYHPYTYPLLPSDNASWNGWQMMEDGIRGAMVAHGDGALQVWMTELGSPTSSSDSRMTADLQEQILKEAVEIAQTESWAGPILWYSYKDRGGSTTDAENWFGLLGPNGQKKDAYYLFQELANADGNAPSPTGSSGTGTQPVSAPAVHEIASGMTNYTITDFKAGDKIDLSALDGNILKSGVQNFKFIGSDWLAQTGDLGVYYDSKNGYTYVQGSTDSDTSFEFSVRINGIHTLTAESFILPTDPSASTTQQTTDSTATTFAITKSTGITRISDFMSGDKIDLRMIDADRTTSGVQDFHFIGSDWLGDAGDLGVYTSTGSNTTYVQGDTNGDDIWDFSVELAGIHSLTQIDFIL
ncbi:MAG: cellulase family glycosylhydrolase [Defluviimonas sp.]|nr:cellulase family glycosylhydrolase [Defluviimonas sp.]